MSDDAFRFDWYPAKAHIKFMSISAEEIAVLVQVINLIYMNRGPIANDGKYISQSIYDMGTARCNRILRNLVEKGHLFVTENGKISQKMTEFQLKSVENRREIRAKSGQKGGKTKAENKRNQTLNSSTLLSTSSSSSITPYSPPGGDENFNRQLERKNQNEKPKRQTRKERLAEIERAALLRAGYDPTVENQEYEDPEYQNHVT